MEEDYDSGIQMYFMREYDLTELLARLIDLDALLASDSSNCVDSIYSLSVPAT